MGYTTLPINELYQLRLRMIELQKDLLIETKQLAVAFQAEQSGLGAHSMFVERLLEAALSHLEVSSLLVKKLTRKIKQTEDLIQEPLGPFIRNEDFYGKT